MGTFDKFEYAHFWRILGEFGQNVNGGDISGNFSKNNLYFLEIQHSPSQPIVQNHLLKIFTHFLRNGWGEKGKGKRRSLQLLSFLATQLKLVPEY